MEAAEPHLRLQKGGGGAANPALGRVEDVSQLWELQGPIPQVQGGAQLSELQVSRKPTAEKASGVSPFSQSGRQLRARELGSFPSLQGGTPFAHSLAPSLVFSGNLV